MAQTNIGIFGSTGSIGQNTLEVVRALPGRFRISFLSSFSTIDLLEEQVREFRPRVVAVYKEEAARDLRHRLDGSVEVLSGEEGLLELARLEETKIVVSALVGFAGVRPTAEAIQNGKDIALANKETLVAAGEYIKGLVREHGVRLLPVDSEHSAILQCLAGERTESITKIILTASGGPFRETPLERFEGITVGDALKHPNWNMGKKITIDSATLMNKGLEVIEAHWLFELPLERIEVVVHPQSIIHSMVEFVDGSIKAQLGVPDMKVPIQYALTYPEREVLGGGRVDFPDLREMTFFEPDVARFPALRLAYDALSAGGTSPAVLNAANEVAVRAFLDEQTTFSSIPGILEETLARHSSNGSVGIEEVVEADLWARETAHSLIQQKSV
jgi:1-deoxy-D-xylulose-5-phosphate reductoisomerase